MERDSSIVGFVVLAVVALSGCGRVSAQPPLNENAEPARASTVVTASAIADAGSAPDSAPLNTEDAAVTQIVGGSADGGSGDGGSADGGSVVALPVEPWYRDRADRRDDCVAPLATTPRPHFPAPFDTCDPRAESYSSPPTGNSLHFHYRFFSVALTTERRAQSPGVCCYMIWQFPR